MKCQEVNDLLVALSDDEVTPSERFLIQAHLAGCEFCQKKQVALLATQARVSRSLQARAAQTTPPPQAWSRLQTRLAREARPASAWLPTWLQRLSPNSDRINPIPSGNLTVSKGLALAALAALIIAISTMIFIPPVRAQVVDTIQHIILGTHSWAKQVILQSKAESQPLPPDTWKIRTEIGNFCGNAPPGVDPAVHSLTSFEEAQAATGFHLKAPVHLPKGYALREIKLAPIGGTHWAFLLYGGPDHDIVIVQMPGGPQPSDEPNVMVSVGIGLITDGRLEEVDFDGHPAVWAGDHSLMWEADGISYLAGGFDLNLAQTLQIARSLR
jgi:hypothetical protein